MWPHLYYHLFLMQPFLSTNPRQINKKACLLKGTLNTSTFCLVSSHKHLLPALSSESWSRTQSSSRTAGTQGAGGSAPWGRAWRQGAESGPRARTDGTRCREPTGRAACSSPRAARIGYFHPQNEEAAAQSLGRRASPRASQPCPRCQPPAVCSAGSDPTVPDPCARVGAHTHTPRPYLP